MKRTALLQAIILFLLLVGSWILLYIKFRSPPVEAPESGEKQEASALDGKASPESPPPTVKAVPLKEEGNPILVPDRWTDWWIYFAAQRSPSEMRVAIQHLREAVFGMSREEAISWLLEIIESDSDMRTGLAFQLGPENSLRGAASLKAILLDWLYALDPQQAAALARDELQTQGTSLVPDVYVMHLRNYGRYHPISDPAHLNFLKDQLTQMLSHDPWIANPNAAIAEAMDVAVFTEAAELAPRLADLIRPDQPQLLRHASALALERLVEQQPGKTLPLLLEAAPAQAYMAEARAGLFARMDPSSAENQNLLEAYLQSPAVSNMEAARFIRSFPNLNQSLSYNLLSNSFPDTAPGNYIKHLENALRQVHQWRQQDQFPELGPELDAAEKRLQSQLEPIP